MTEEQTKKYIQMFTIYGSQEKDVSLFMPEVFFNEIVEFDDNEDAINQILNKYEKVEAIYMGSPKDNYLIYKKEEK